MSRTALFTLPLALFCFFSTACDTPLQNAPVSNLYAFSVPGYLDAVADLHSRAPLQYENARREVYVIALDVDRQTADTPRKLDAFLDQQASPYEEHLITRTSSDDRPALRSGIKTLQRESYGSLRRNNAEVWQLFTAYELPQRYVFLACWTLKENRSRYEADLRAIVDSFRPGSGAAPDTANTAAP
ncbi:MAG: hypothetical protein K1X75_08235 [Leptospirales bacterium]|nr:hypothetical protein [Leptospirales bacterium]